MSKLFVNLGKLGHLNPGDLAGLFYREAGLPDGAVGRIKIFPKHTLVDVQTEFADQVIARCQNVKLRGRKLRVDYDRGPGRKRER